MNRHFNVCVLGDEREGCEVGGIYSISLFRTSDPVR